MPNGRLVWNSSCLRPTTPEVAPCNAMENVEEVLHDNQNEASMLTPLGTGERKGVCWDSFHCANKCKVHHNGPMATRTLTCYECGNQGHYKSDCLELKNGNQAGGAGTRGMLLAVVGGEPNQDLGDIEDNTNA
ncbi:reverse transcriptase domain-containing protein [Tanacetum coccineum]|uniref:Reverse transcriptase domain-containing protein n=1 Tax=Tanacetum coccineum TaxID=301880 RepID=A0ABQ5FAE3_9ASTR